MHAKPLIKEVADDLFLIRVDDRKTKYFEALWEIPEGITYNAYLLRLDSGSVVFDGVKAGYSEEFIEALSSLVNPKNIRYVVVNHAEPDHTGSIKKLMRLTGDKATVLGHPMTSSLLKSLHGIKPAFKAVKDGEILDVGGESLRFIHTPWLHWPETMVTYLVKRSVLISCDVFGGYSIPSGVFDDEVDVSEYLPYVKKYSVTVIGHYRGFVLKALEKLKALGIKPSIIAPGHGLLWRKDPGMIIKEYEMWDRAEPVKGKVTVIYSSMYGYVEAAVNHVIEGLKSAGFNVKVFKFTDEFRSNISDVLSEVDDSQGVVIGTATYEAGVFPIMTYLVSLLKSKIGAKKPVLAITTYGWGDVAGRFLMSMLKDTGFNVVDAVSVHGVLDEGTGKRLDDAVRKFIAELG